MRDTSVCMYEYICAVSTRAYIHILNYTYIYEKSMRMRSAPRFTSLLLLFASDGERENVIWIVFDLPLESCNFPLIVEYLSVNNDRNTYIAFQICDTRGARRTKSCTPI